MKLGIGLSALVALSGVVVLWISWRGNTLHSTAVVAGVVLGVALILAIWHRNRRRRHQLRAMRDSALW